GPQARHPGNAGDLQRSDHFSLQLCDVEPVVRIGGDGVKALPIARMGEAFHIQRRRFGTPRIAGMGEDEDCRDVVGRGFADLHESPTYVRRGARARAMPSTSSANTAGSIASGVPAASAAPVPAHRIEAKASPMVAAREATWRRRKSAR